MQQIVTKALEKPLKKAAEVIVKKGPEWVGKNPDKALAIVVTVGGGVGKLSQRVSGQLLRASRANDQAWTLEGGAHSENIRVMGKNRSIVWQNGEAIACFPEIKLAEGQKLGDLPELRSVKDSLKLAPTEPTTVREDVLTKIRRGT